MSIIFFILALMSTLGYNLQWALNTKFARKGDALSMGTYRSLSLAISMLPILLLSNFDNILSIYKYQFDLLIASLASAFGVRALFNALKILPLGITTSFRYIASVLSAVTFGYFLFNEKLSSLIIFFILIIIIGGVIISLSKVDFEHLESKGFYKGIFLSILAGLGSATGVSFMVKVSRELDPYTAGYFWELEIGIALVMILLFRKKFGGGKIEKISSIDFIKILLASSPSLVGTGAYALASLYGPIGVASAIGVLGIAFSGIFGIYLFKEKLKLIQYFGMLVIIVGIIGIKLL